MEWLRLYAEMPNDPKIGTLTDGEFRTFVELLCKAAEAEADGNTKLTDETINWALRRDVTVTLPRLLERRLVTRNARGEYVITAWEKRQYKSDKSRERMRLLRDRRKENIAGNNDLGKCDVTSDVTSDGGSDVTCDAAVRHGDGLEKIQKEQELKSQSKIYSKSKIKSAPPLPPSTEPAPPPAAGPTPEARACLLMRQAGCARVNPSHPDLRAAVAEGVTAEALAATVAEGVAAGKGEVFAWAIATARGRHRDGARAPPAHAKRTARPSVTDDFTGVTY